MNILKSRKALSAGFPFLRFFNSACVRCPRTTWTVVFSLSSFLAGSRAFFSLATISSPHFFSVPLSRPFPGRPPFSFLRFIPEAFLPPLAVPSRSINQCGIFALAGLTERPRCHLWTLKRVANIAKQEITNCCELWNTYEHLRDRRSLFPSSVPVAAFVACSASLQFPSCVRRRLRLCLSCHVISLVFPSD